MFSPMVCFVFVGGKFCRLTLQVAQIVANQLQAGHRVVWRRAGVNIQALGLQRLAHRDGLTRVAHDARRVEVNVGQRGEEGTRRKVINFMVNDAIFTSLNGPGGEALQGGNQQILQIGGFGRFTAHTLRVRAAVPCGGTDGLFTLHTKHGHTFFKVIFNIHV
ncbi:Uncharacterised protein [Raoultella terrigena]|uniref:Uncharacterized protein n=1 Tax=Raoultella terrigena TaxID=577 RepID=A0A485B878_RAOTE|nr:Uncharacterised protein [Raoultella terrigena]